MDMESMGPVVSFIVKLIASLRRILLGLPKISVTGAVATVLGDDLREIRFVITAINDGTAAVQVSAVSLRSTDGGFHYSGPTDLDRGPRLPVELPPLGGRAVWMLDYKTVQNRAARVVRDTSPEVRATLQIGTRTYKQSNTIRIPIDGVPNAPVPILRRIKARSMSVVSPYFFINPFVDLSGVDLDKNTAPLHVTKRGWGVSRPLRLSLVVRHEDGRSERVPNVPPILIPRMWRPRLLVLRVPLVNDEAALPNNSFSWLTTAGKAPGSGHGAHTRSEIVAALTTAGLIGSAVDTDSPSEIDPPPEASNFRAR
jgi:hypothetical protein